MMHRHEHMGGSKGGGLPLYCRIFYLLGIVFPLLFSPLSPFRPLPFLPALPPPLRIWFCHCQWRNYIQLCRGTSHPGRQNFSDFFFTIPLLFGARAIPVARILVIFFYHSSVVVPRSPAAALLPLPPPPFLSLLVPGHCWCAWDIHT